MVNLTFEISILAAKRGVDCRLPKTDSIILATAQIYEAVIWTQGIILKE